MSDKIQGTTLDNSFKRLLLWERGAQAAPEDVATPTITTIKPLQGDEDVSRTKGQSNEPSGYKGSNSFFCYQTFLQKTYKNPTSYFNWSHFATSSLIFLFVFFVSLP